MPSESLAQLKILKLQLNSQRMSVLIGAGFSKNVSDKYPTWTELLREPAFDLYKSEIEEKYLLYSSLNKTRKIDREGFNKEKVDEILVNVGYLQVVSNIIANRGYREVISSYIEERTPYLNKTKGKISYKIKGIPYEDKLQKNDLNIHKKLIQLPWNNIYTTNYDNLLESAIDKDIRDKIIRLQEKLKSQITTLLNEKKEKEEEKQTEEDTEKDSDQNNNTVKLDEQSPDLKTEKEKKIEPLNQKLVQLNYRLNEIDRLLKSHESDLNILETGLNDCLNLVTKSTDLKIKRNKNIIKLHGTLRSEEDKAEGIFGFDGDPYKHYVISKEDFAAYPEKHEAFTQLMRISLLQESYCLMGFSGSDPNFLAWIGWVRDVLERKQNGKEKREFKIFIIDLDGEEIPADKSLFFDNHRITRISLSDPEVVKFLEIENNKQMPTRPNKKELLENLLNYLSGNSEINKSKVILEKLSLKKYDALWNSVSFSFTDEVDEQFLSKIVTHLEDIKTLKKEIRIPSISFSKSSNKQSLVHFTSKFLVASQKYAPELYTEKLLELFAIAMKDSFIPIRTQLLKEDVDLIRKLSKSKNIEIEFQIFELRSYLLENNKRSFIKRSKKLQTNKEIADLLTYERLMLLAFNFNFEQLANDLNKWSPSSFWITKKAGLLALIDTEKAKTLLSEYNWQFDAEPVQEQMLAVELYGYLFQSTSWTMPNQIKEKIGAYENNNVESIKKNLEYIIEEIKDKPFKLKPYGDRKFSVSTPISLSSKPPHLASSIQFLQILMESGFPISLNNVYYENPENWYKICFNIFEVYPFPAIFYSLQYSNQELLKRIGQDFAYSEQLTLKVKTLSNVLLSIYLKPSTPQRYKNSTLYFVSELFNSLPAKNWQVKFYSIWKSQLVTGRVFKDRHLPEYTFCMKGLQLIMDKGIIENIYLDILRNFSKNPDPGLDYLYKLASNPHTESFKVKTNSLLYKQIQALIAKIPKETENALYAIGNLNSILSRELKRQIVAEITKLDPENIDSDSVWRVLLYYGGSDAKIKNMVKAGIIKSDYLWYNGITDRKISMGGKGNIVLHRLEKNKGRKNGIVWSKKENLQIFTKLKRSLTEIEDVVKTRPELDLYSNVSEEMLYFLQSKYPVLKGDHEYNDILKRCETLYNSQKGYSDLDEGLSSTDSTKVVWALSELNRILYYNKFEEGKPLIGLLLNKILLVAPEGLEATLSYVSFWLYDLRDKEDLREYSQVILRILKKYMALDLKGFEKPVVQEHLIKLASVLDFWKFKSEYIEFWLKMKRESRFNNIKFMSLP